MAPQPEYDKEPKAPDKSTAAVASDDIAGLNNLSNEHISLAENQTNSDPKPAGSTSHVDVEKKHVETLNEKDLRALLDETINYKSPKDREGKSVLFQKLLKEAEKDDAACEEAARGYGASRAAAARRAARGPGRRPELAHSNSLQDVAALAADTPPRRRHAHQQHAHTNVSARAHHGGSLPSGVDTTFHVCEEPMRGRKEYVATVQCINPPPQVERRVSASDAHCAPAPCPAPAAPAPAAAPPAAAPAAAPAPHDTDHNSRNKPLLTFTSTKTVDIGSGGSGGGSGRAVTTTTASNQVPEPRANARPRGGTPPQSAPHAPRDYTYYNQMKLTSALLTPQRKRHSVNDGADAATVCRGQGRRDEATLSAVSTGDDTIRDTVDSVYMSRVDRWYEGLNSYKTRSYLPPNDNSVKIKNDVSHDNKQISQNILTDDTRLGSLADPKENSNSAVRTHCASYKSDRKVRQSDYDKWDIGSAVHCRTDSSNSSSYRFYDYNPTAKNSWSSNKNSIGYNVRSRSATKMYPGDYNRNLRLYDYDKYDFELKSRQHILSQYRRSGSVSPGRRVCFDYNPTNIRPMTIGNPVMANISDTSEDEEEAFKIMPKSKVISSKNQECKELIDVIDKSKITSNVLDNLSPTCSGNNSETVDMTPMKQVCSMDESMMGIEMEEISSTGRSTNSSSDRFNRYVNDQHRLMRSLEISTVERFDDVNGNKDCIDRSKSKPDEKDQDLSEINQLDKNDEYINDKCKSNSDILEIKTVKDTEDTTLNKINTSNREDEKVLENSTEKTLSDDIEDFVDIRNSRTNSANLKCEEFVVGADANKGRSIDQYVLQLPNNALMSLTLSELITSLSSHNDETKNVFKLIISPKPVNVKATALKPHSKKKETQANQKRLSIDAVNKRALRILLFENHRKSKSNSEYFENSKSDMTGRRSDEAEVDTAISFSCITTPEVVASCTTAPSSQASAAGDAKSRGGNACGVNGLPRAAPAAAPATPASPAAAPATAPTTPAAAAPAAATNADEQKKSLDENGNSLQSNSSPPSGSSQPNKKPRRKKSSKNETLIDLNAMSGYQGNKDLKELLRFIEADDGRGHKLGRAKHKDDADDKGGKKRSSERRKDKESKVKRATSLEELSRTKLEDLTDEPEPAPAEPRRAPDDKPVAERRSWGEGANETFRYRRRTVDVEPDASGAAAVELTDFQTVTKKRKPRRRADEPERDPAPRRARAPSPSPRATRASAPPSDRSNDSNDDMDSVHSLPADAPSARTPHAPLQTPLPLTLPLPVPAPAPAPVSYADIARTRHNIPDLIESCNYYAEGEGGPEARRAPPSGEEPPALAQPDPDYPALEARSAAQAARRMRDKPSPPAPAPVAPGTAPDAGLGAPVTGATAAPARRDRKERVEAGRAPGEAPPAAPPPPAPDVVADRRPPVILLDSAARPRDMDGVTFGFDINEQLLSGPARRPRCDLVRDAVEGARPVPAAAAAAAAAPAPAPAPGAVAVRAGCARLQYVPPDTAPDAHHLQLLVDYVGNAWEDLMRGGGKVRYYAE